MKIRTIRALLVCGTVFAFGGCFPIGCGGRDAAEPVSEIPSPPARVEQCLENNARGRYWEALKDSEAVLEANPENAGAHYCAALAHFGVIVDTISAIISAAANLNHAPEYRASIDGKQFLLPFVEDIEAGIAGIDRHAYALIGMSDHPTLFVESFPLPLNLGDLAKLLAKIENVPIEVQGEAEIDLAGAWDVSHIQLLAGLGNLVQTGIDYLFAHDLNLDNPEALFFETSAQIAYALHANPRFGKPAGTRDHESRERMTGGESYKGVRLGALSALSYLVGRETHLERVAPANDGLRMAIRVNAGRSDGILIWTDRDHDGIPERITIPALEQLNRTLTVTVEGKPYPIPSEFENPFSADFWMALEAFAIDLRENIETGSPGSVGLKRLADAALVELDENAAMRTAAARCWPAAVTWAGREFPDLVYLNPRAFLEDPPYLRNLIPWYFSYTTDGTQIGWELALEIEGFAGGMTVTNRKAGLELRAEPGADFEHFDYAPGADGIPAYAFEDFETEPAPIPADTLRPTAEVPELFYLALQDPSFGGLLRLKTASLETFPETGALTSSPVPLEPDNAVFNATLNALRLY